MKHILIFLSIFFISEAACSQPSNRHKGNGFIFGPSIGYQYQSGNFLKSSGWLLFAPGDSHSQYIKIDGGANFTWMMDKTTVIPELSVTYYLSNILAWPFVKAEITPYTINPKAGISLSSLLDIGLGYGFEINERKEFKSIQGFNFSVGLNIPLNFYL